jgi:exodeoxyribonuclease III
LLKYAKSIYRARRSPRPLGRVSLQENEKKRNKLFAMSTKLLTWNVNGIRAACRAGFLNWFENEQADIVCLQEIKATPEQLEEIVIHPLGYHSFWNPAQKPGYSGVALYTKREPLEVTLGIGIPEIDYEGRVIVAKYPEFVLLNAYFPNSQREHARLGYKLKFCEQILNFCNQLKSQGQNVVLCGDLNIAHNDIDLKNPKSNMNNAGFLPEERAWMDVLLNQGYVDGFRNFVKDPGHYTWWSYRPGVRENNIGWRLDYFIVNQEFKDRLQIVSHHPMVKGSDHCPVMMELS